MDIGAHHPFRFSNTAFFYNKGWKGVNVEASPMLIDNFRKYRKRDINLNVGIANENSELTFYMFEEQAFNTFSEETAKHYLEDLKIKPLKKLSIQTYKLSEILDKYLSKNKTIDFLTIDAEGLDLAILQSNNWDKYVPTYICAENCHDGEDEIFIYLTQQKYTKIAQTLRTSIYKRNDNQHY